MRRELYFEHQESEKLLRNTLPREAVERLKKDISPVADFYESAAVIHIEVSFSSVVLDSEAAVALSEVFIVSTI